MFIYCKKCDWSQDDFWSKEYNPLKVLLSWQMLYHIHIMRVNME